MYNIKLEAVLKGASHSTYTNQCVCVLVCVFVCECVFVRKNAPSYHLPGVIFFLIRKIKKYYSNDLTRQKKLKSI